MVKEGEETGPIHYQMTRNIGQILRICQLNIEGIKKSKCQYVGKIMKENGVDILLIEEEYVENDDQVRSCAKIPGYGIFVYIFCVTMFLFLNVLWNHVWAYDK